MLIWILIIAACVKFHNFARDNGLNKWLWAFMPLAGYLLTVILVILVMLLIDPTFTENQGALLIGEVISASLGVGIPYFLMHMSAKRKDEREDSTLLDNDI